MCTNVYLGGTKRRWYEKTGYRYMYAMPSCGILWKLPQVTCVFLVQWNLDLTNFYMTKSLAEQTIFYSLTKVTVKCMKQNLDVMNLDITTSLL